MSTTSFADGRVLLHGGEISRIELNAPERRNAMSRAMWAAMAEICDVLDGDDSVRVVLLTAASKAGKPAFCAGADISEFEEVYATPQSTKAYNRLVRDAQSRLRSLARPLLARISGACVGGGCGLALAADLRFADHSVRMGITPTRLGLAYSPEDTLQLIEKVGPTVAKDLLFSARLVEAEEARAIGLIDRLVAPDALEDAVMDYARQLAGLSAQSIRAAKTIVNGLTAAAPVDLSPLRSVFEASFDSEDFREGRQAFLERRPPRFR
ncbi:enoyl-CoA hydratase-related protein (plasmid) [Sulfitobacter sp. LCG007]